MPSSSSPSSPKLASRRQPSEGLLSFVSQPANDNEKTHELHALDEEAPPDVDPRTTTAASSASGSRSSARPQGHKKKKKKHKKNTSSGQSRSVQSSQDPSGRGLMNQPSGTSLGRSINVSYDDEERNPLTGSSNGLREVNIPQDYRPHGVHEDSFDDDNELFPDTFTFLMTATYPLESCCRPDKKKKKAQMDDDVAEGMDRSVGTRTYSTVRFAQVDPDAWFLPFWTGSFVILSQLFIYTVVIANVFIRGEIPPNADRWLRLAQIFAVLVTLYTQSDFIDGIFMITERWKAFKEITTPIKFNLSAILRVIAGNAGILATFSLVMYSTEVVDLLLNFAAMEFVATLDDSAFELAAKGFLGATLEKKCLEIQDFRYVRKMRRGSWTRILVYLFYVILVFGAFLTIVAMQASRSIGVDNEVYVQFDDTRVPELFGISGVYKGCKGVRTRNTGGIGYVDVGAPCPELNPTKDDFDEFPGRSFIYCFSLDGWVYLKEPTPTPCEAGNHLIRSYLDDQSVDSNAFDILTHAQANWLVQRSAETGGEALLRDFFIESTLGFEDTFVYCVNEGNGGGLVRTDKDQRIFEAIPEEAGFYPKFEGEKIFRQAFGLSYRPVYTREILHQQDKFQVITFNGLRWERLYLNPRAFARNISREDDCDDVVDPDCWKIFIKHSRTSSAWRFNDTVVVNDAISDPMMFLSPGDTGPPTDQLRWYETRLEDGRVLPGKPYEEGGLFSTTALGFECAKPSIELECQPGEETLIISVTTDRFPSETRVIAFYGQDIGDIQELSRAVVQTASKGANQFIIPQDGLIDLRFASSTSSHELGTCLPVVPGDQECIQVVIIDSFGDGLNPPGDYEIIYGTEDPVAPEGNGEFGCRRYQFGAGCIDSVGEQQDCAREADIESKYPEEIIGGAGADTEAIDNFFDDDFELEEGSDVDLFTIPPTLFSSEIPDLGEIPEYDLFCGPDEVPLRVQVSTDDWSHETEILTFLGQSPDDIGFITSAQQLSPLANTGTFEAPDDSSTLVDLRFPDDYTAYVVGSCIPAATSCLQVLVLDTENDGIFTPGGYSISYGDDFFLGDGSFGCRSYQFGSGCLNFNEMPSSCDLVAIRNSKPTDVTEDFF